MPHIDPATVALIKERANIYDVVSRFVELKKSGVRYLGLCPFHDDHTLGSFVVYPKGNIFKCFACGEKGSPIDFLMKHLKMDYPTALRYLAPMVNVYIDDAPADYTPPPPRPKPPVLPTLVLPMKIVLAREHTEHDTLCQWLRGGSWWTDEQRARIEKVLAEYHVGHSVQGMTIFWQIDELNMVRTGKMMRYGSDGHRVKTKGYNFDWIHSSLSRPVIMKGADGWPVFDDQGNPVMEHRNLDIYDERKEECRPTCFGMHLLNRYPAADIHIVESEKTAVIMAIAFGNSARSLWMACGGLEMLSRDRLLPIINQRRTIILYPDRDGVKKWQAKARAIGYDLIVVNTDPVLRWWHEGDSEKADIADIVIRQLREQKK